MTREVNKANLHDFAKKNSQQSWDHLCEEMILTAGVGHFYLSWKVPRKLYGTGTAAEFAFQLRKLGFTVEEKLSFFAHKIRKLEIFWGQ